MKNLKFFSFIKNIKINHVARSSFIVAFFFGIDKILGFVRQLLVARQFALSYDLDVFNAANNIPDLLPRWFPRCAGYCLATVLSEYLEKKGKKERGTFLTNYQLAFCVTALIAFIIVFMHPGWWTALLHWFSEEQKTGQWS